MGVRRLQTFMKTEVPNGYTPIDIIEAAATYKRNNNGKTPTIVFDIMALAAPLQLNKKDILCGGRNQITLNIFETFLSALKSNGIELVFFCDGPVFNLKLDEWTERQTKQYAQCGIILKKIYNHTSLNEIVNDPELVFANITSILNLNVLPCAKKYGSVTKVMDQECDTALAKYATENDVMAIISNDSDFLIYAGNWQLWSSDINFENFETFHFNRLALQSYLCLSSQQLPIFATLAGNDFMTYDDIRHFRYKMKGNFKNIANYVRVIKHTAFNLTDQELQSITKFVFGHYSNRNFNKIKNSIGVYNLNTQQPIYCEPILKVTQVTYVYSWIINQPVTISISPYCDWSKTDLLPFQLLTVNMLRRQMGIVFYNRKDEHINRLVYVKRHHFDAFKMVSLLPDYPYEEIPIYEDLINAEKKELNVIRWKLLCWLISDNLNSDIIRNIPKEYLIYVLVLFYLVQRRQLTTLEADAFLLTIDEVNNNRIPENIEYPEYLNERTTRIQFLFHQIFICISGCFKIVCLNDYIEYFKMDGVYCHKVVENLKLLPDDAYQNYVQQILDYRIYCPN